MMLLARSLVLLTAAIGACDAFLRVPGVARRVVHLHMGVKNHFDYLVIGE
jgi:hypothetical protein